MHHKAITGSPVLLKTLILTASTHVPYPIHFNSMLGDAHFIFAQGERVLSERRSCAAMVSTKPGRSMI